MRELKRRADFGKVDCQLFVANKYYRDAISYFNKAAAQGNQQAIDSLNEINKISDAIKSIKEGNKKS